MITNKDIQKLIVAFKAIFPTREEVKADRDELRGDFRSLQTSVDIYAKKANDYYQEMVILNHRVTDVEIRVDNLEKA